jgi:DNA polymerase-3 subunit delta'
MAKRAARESKDGADSLMGRASVTAAPLPKVEEAVRPPAPVPLSSLLGQDRASGILMDALRADRVHHAWIFHGPAGVGKCTAAAAFAAMLLDPTTAAGLSGEIEADPESATQQMLRAGSHPDLHYLAKELATFSRFDSVRNSKQKFIGTDLTQEFLIEPLTRTGRAPAGARATKVAIVDGADLMNREAQNRMLKTLEEPGAGVVIILVTSAEEELLPTIRSRCQRVYFGPLGRVDMDRWIARRGLDLPPDELSWLREFAAGSPGALLEAHSSGLFGWWTRLAPMLDASARGEHVATMGPLMEELTKAYAAGVVDQNPSASKDAANRSGTEAILRLVAHWARQRLRASVRQGGEPDGTALSAIDLIRAAEREADANVAMIFVFEKLSAELAAAGRGDALSPAH